MKKRIICGLLILCLLLTLLAPMAFATEDIQTSEPAQPLSETATEPSADPTEPSEPSRAPDQCGESMTWKYEDGILTVTGTGAMDDFPEGAPWAAHRESITDVIFIGGVSYIGESAFQDCDKLKDIDFGNSLREIGKRAFYSCDSLESVELPKTFKIFGEESFRSCRNLKEIHCNGGFPSFRRNCLWDSYVTIYFPVGGPWPVSLIQELEEAFHGRIEFIASDGTDPYVPEEPTEPTEPEETVPAETVPADTIPVAPTPTEPVVTEPVEMPTAPAPTTEPTQPTESSEPTEPDDEEEDERNGIGTGLLIVIIAGAVLAVGGLLVAPKKRPKGKWER